MKVKDNSQNIIEKGYCNFDLIDHYESSPDEWKKQKIIISEIDGFKRTYPPPEGVRKLNILV